MYLTLGIMLLLFTWAFTGLGQKSSSPSKTREEKIKSYMEAREEMFRRLRESLFKGQGINDDIFKDMEALGQDLMSDSFSGISGLSDFSSNNFKMEWNESKEGRTLLIAPQDQGQQLDINVQNGMVIVKGKTERKGPQGTSVSSFSNSFNVPTDCDANAVKMDQKNGKIVLFFPYSKDIKKVEIPSKENEQKDDNDRRPLKPSEGDIEL